MPSSGIYCVDMLDNCPPSREARHATREGAQHSERRTPVLQYIYASSGPNCPRTGFVFLPIETQKQSKARNTGQLCCDTMAAAALDENAEMLLDVRASIAPSASPDASVKSAMRGRRFLSRCALRTRGFIAFQPHLYFFCGPAGSCHYIEAPLVYVAAQCARYGEGEEVSQLLAQGVPADVVDENGRSALFFTAANGHAEVMQLLLAHGAVRDEHCTRVHIR